jgi:hypothetical protein
VGETGWWRNPEAKKTGLEKEGHYISRRIPCGFSCCMFALFLLLRRNKENRYLSRKEST